MAICRPVSFDHWMNNLDRDLERWRGLLTVCSVGRDDAAHPNLWGTFEQAFGDNSIGFGDTFQAAAHGENSIMHALHDLTDTCLHAGLVTEICDVLACFSNDDTSLFGRYDGTKSQL